MRRAWQDAMRALGGHPYDEAVRDLERRYAEPHRRYHTTTHVEAVLRDSAWLAAELSLTERERAIVAMAACAHDVVYVARPGDDERASAEWARDALGAGGIAKAVTAEVERLVLATIEHAADPADRVAGVLLDADLAILGSDAGTYGDYVAAVRAEYSAVSDDAWRSGRAAVLRHLLDRNPLFVTEGARRRWEAAARTNIAREMAQL